MHRILVTGGNGVLGRQLTTLLAEGGGRVRVMSRHARPAAAPGRVEWQSADLATGQGLTEAVADVSVIVHAASSPYRRTQSVDVDGTRRLLDAARAAGVAHFVYISIVGIDRVPYAYYRHKLAAEHVIEGAGLPFTILRATQFHDLLDTLLARMTHGLPVAALPLDFQFQLVDSGEVAARLAEIVARGPAGRVPDMGGPEVLRLKEIAAAWLQARGQRKLIVPLPVWGGYASALRRGLNTCPANRQGRITWAAWLEQTYARKEALHAA